MQTTFFAPKSQIHFIPWCFEEVDFLPPNSRLPGFLMRSTLFMPKIRLSYLDPCMSANVFLRQKVKYTLSRGVLKKSTFYSQKVDFPSKSGFLMRSTLFLPKIRPSYLDPCISANVFFRAKNLNTLYPEVF